MTHNHSLKARLEGAIDSVELSDGRVISFRHPEGTQISAAFARAGIDFDAFRRAKDDGGTMSKELAESAARMDVAHEYIGGYCIVDIQPRPELPDGAPFRCRDSLGLRGLSEAALDAIDPYASRLGAYLLEQSDLSEAEGEG